MKDRLVFSILAAVAVLTVALAAVWPQGYGARSPGPLGHTPTQQTPEMQAALARQDAAAEKRRQMQRASAAIAAGLRPTH
jgi:hypothetical protein